ncbi:MAG: hypothetical protein ACFNKF_08325 [Treponema lecithinolyticum]|uniref:hypothetical protein n=1 Tax=Treponema lecithinolyticum TaxID=53418 RepID=UPI003619D6D9
MKKFLTCISIIILLGSIIGCENTKKTHPVSLRESSEKKLQIEIKREKAASLQLAEIDSDYEYVSFFYQNICFDFDLINKVDKEQLREACKIIYDSLKEKYKVQFIIKNYINEADLYFSFGQFEEDNKALLITSNFDVKKNALIEKNGDFTDSWAILYYIVNGKLISYHDIDKADLLIDPAEEIKRLEEESKKNPAAITYINITENYYKNNEIEKGLEYLYKNKDNIMSLSIKTDKSGDINDVFNCVEQEGLVLRMLKSR